MIYATPTEEGHCVASWELSEPFTGPKGVTGMSIVTTHFPSEGITLAVLWNDKRGRESLMATRDYIDPFTAHERAMIDLGFAIQYKFPDQGDPS